ncbi:family 16 glycoside hydrolase [Actinomadura spongiicola]|uniref:family 16 glycoside hydrolase n=1 Tax=Actinomadura spongiicola TaxID=2303421 RepID=UPI0018F1D156|nr:family 16 glycoside hydrolase [Actinomadura spongiicola]
MPDVGDHPTTHRATRALRWSPALALAALLTVAAVSIVADRGGGDAFVRWRDGTVHGPWRSVYDGHGLNGTRGDVISLCPKKATDPAKTHAGLVVSRERHGNMEFRLRARTVAQLRVGKPNPWEAAWIVWAYSDDGHFYYFIPKPTGWELGKRDPAYPGGQRFLATGGGRFSIGRQYTVSVVHNGPRMAVRVDGELLTTFTDTERPYTGGSVGLYTEDAEVEFRDITVHPRP